MSAKSPFSSPFAHSVTVTAAGVETRTLRAFIQPLSLETPAVETPRATVAGVTDPRRWLLILDTAELPEGPIEITDGGDVYELLRRETIAGHVEGILRKSRKGAAAHHA